VGRRGERVEPDCLASTSPPNLFPLILPLICSFSPSQSSVSFSASPDRRIGPRVASHTRSLFGRDRVTFFPLVFFLLHFSFVFSSSFRTNDEKLREIMPRPLTTYRQANLTTKARLLAATYYFPYVSSSTIFPGLWPYNAFPYGLLC
jgi:hypothetical protein